MSSQENEARKQLRTGTRGEYEMRPLDQFTVTTTERPDVPAGYWQALDKAFRAAEPLVETAIDTWED